MCYKFTGGDQMAQCKPNSFNVVISLKCMKKPKCSQRKFLSQNSIIFLIIYRN